MSLGQSDGENPNDMRHHCLGTTLLSLVMPVMAVGRAFPSPPMLAPPLTFMLLELLLREADVLVGEVGHELLVLLLQLGDLGKEVLRFPSPHVLHQLQLLRG